MPKFDVKTFLELAGKGASPIQSIGTAFGMPSCLINLGADVLSLLPSPILGAIRGSTAAGSNRADDVTKSVMAGLRFKYGFIEFDTEEGVFRFVSDSSDNGQDKDSGSMMKGLGSFVGALGEAAGFAGRLYNNYNATVEQINSIKECIGTYNEYLKYSGSNAADKRAELEALDSEAYGRLMDSEFGASRRDLEEAIDFKKRADSLIKTIDSILLDRTLDPSLEPEFTDDYTDILSGTNSNVAPKTPKKEVIRLSFAPPKSKKGKFLLSVDGLYYDSQTSGIVPALLDIESRRSDLDPTTLWKLEHDPNLGGKGKQVSLEDFKYYVNTVLDPNIIDDSNFLRVYYEADNLLVDLIGQKNRRIFDTSSQIYELQASGGSQVLISNLRQVMLSETSHFMEKINKRKKQIELAIKLPSMYGRQPATIGNIPVNDFSYLNGTNYKFDVEKQKSLILDQSEVESVVLPLNVVYADTDSAASDVVLDHLYISNIPTGNIVSNPDGVEVPSLTVNSDIIRDGLIAQYNFLDGNTQSDPSSTNFKLHNSSDLGTRLNGLLIGETSSIYKEGVGVAYLEGITKHSSANPTIPSAVGSFVRLPDEPELVDLLYNPKGATIDTWIHVPELDGETYGFGVDGQVSGLYRLILANENTGIHTGVSAQGDILNMMDDRGSNFVKGFIFGFTRDVRITQNASPTNVSHDNPISDVCLFMAPTLSYDSSSVGFISRAMYDSDNCDGTSTWHNMKFSIWNTVNGVSLSSCGREFCHIAATFDPQSNEISMYADGVKLATSSYGDVFGIEDPRKESVNIPTFKQRNSFEYNVSSMSSVNVTQLKYGPKLDQYFTPWIVGGGYTDGNRNGNFMGGLYGGIISGLKGYVGGTKFYSRALSPDEILNNYQVHSEFFKNIDVPNLMWEPIESV